MTNDENTHFVAKLGALFDFRGSLDRHSKKISFLLRKFFMRSVGFDCDAIKNYRHHLDSNAFEKLAS